MAILLFTIGPTDLEINQYLGVTATKRLLEVDSLTSIDLSNIVEVIVHLPADYVYFNTNNRAKDCKAESLAKILERNPVSLSVLSLWTLTTDIYRSAYRQAFPCNLYMDIHWCPFLEDLSLCNCSIASKNAELLFLYFHSLADTEWEVEVFCYRKNALLTGAMKHVRPRKRCVSKSEKIVTKHGSEKSSTCIHDSVGHRVKRCKTVRLSSAI